MRTDSGYMLRMGWNWNRDTCAGTVAINKVKKSPDASLFATSYDIICSMVRLVPEEKF